MALKLQLLIHSWQHFRSSSAVKSYKWQLSSLAYQLQKLFYSELKGTFSSTHARTHTSTKAISQSESLLHIHGDKCQSVTLCPTGQSGNKVREEQGKRGRRADLWLANPWGPVWQAHEQGNDSEERRQMDGWKTDKSFLPDIQGSWSAWHGNTLPRAGEILSRERETSHTIIMFCESNRPFDHMCVCKVTSQC